MRKVILQEFVTLNGLAAGPDDSVDFIPASTRGDRSFGDDQFAFLDTIDTILLGRVTYRMFARHWPNVTEGEEQSFADKLNAKQKIVFSQTLDRAPWGTWDEGRIVKTSAADEVAKLKGQSGKDIVVWGSISLAQSLVGEGPIDEYRLVVCPVVLGSGRPLFGDMGAAIDLKLLDVKALDLGAVSLKYIRRNEAIVDASRFEIADQRAVLITGASSGFTRASSSRVAKASPRRCVPIAAPARRLRNLNTAPK